MNRKNKILTFVFLAAVFFVFQNGVALAGFGVSPPTLANKNLVPGSFYEQDIYLVQGKPEQDLHVTVKVDAGKINNWIKIENGNAFDIPKGTQQFPMKVDVSVPSNAALGNYKGKITISTLPATANKGGVQVTLGAEIAIDLDVTSIQISDFSIQNFQIPDIAKGSPIKFVIKVKNDGNTENGPTKVGLTFFDQYHSKQLGSQEENITEKVPSFQTKDVSVEFPNNLDVGQYWADVKIYSNDKVAVDSKMIFNVLSAAQAKEKQKSFVFTMPNFSAIPFWIYLLIAAIVIILLLVIIIVVILVKLKKKKPEKKYAEENSEEIKKIKIHETKK